jgi:hypothetical protein
MPKATPSLALTLDRRIVEHPEARHIRRMRIAIWLYLYLLARHAKGADSVEIAPADVASDMGLPEGTIRSWLGHLRHAGYVEVTKLNGTLRILIRKHQASDPPAPAVPKQRFFTVAKLQAALGEPGNAESLQAALNLHPDAVIKRALAGALAVPGEQIKKSKTALFLYLVKKYGQET